MKKLVNEYKYLLSLFVYVMRHITSHINTVYRLIYIYRVSMGYLTGNNILKDEIVINQDLGVGDYHSLQEALALVVSDGYIQVDNNCLIAGDELDNFISDLREKSKKAREDLQRIAYFVDIVASYGEDVILAIFFEEPNVAYASIRNRSIVRLTENKFAKLLSDFETIANSEGLNVLDKYDVFIRWLDFILDQYLKGKR